MCRDFITALQLHLIGWFVYTDKKKIFIDATIKLTPLFKAAIPGDLDTPTKRPSLCHVNEQTTLSQPAT